MSERMDELEDQLAARLSGVTGPHSAANTVRAMIEEATREAAWDRTVEEIHAEISGEKERPNGERQHNLTPDDGDEIVLIPSIFVTEGERCDPDLPTDRCPFCKKAMEPEAAEYLKDYLRKKLEGAPTDVPDPSEDPDVLSDWVLQCSECGHVGRVRRLRRDPNADVPEAPVWFDPPTDGPDTSCHVGIVTHDSVSWAIRFLDKLYEGLIDGLPERSAAELRADLEEMGFDVDRLLAAARVRIHPDTETEP